MCDDGGRAYIYISIFRRKIVIYVLKIFFYGDGGMERDGKGWEGDLEGWDFLSNIGEF